MYACTYLQLRERERERERERSTLLDVQDPDLLLYNTWERKRIGTWNWTVAARKKDGK
jgi:hypothetical protein